MVYRYTEEDLAAIKAKQKTDLSKFQQNSGRGLPEATVQEMEDADGLKRDEHGEVIPPKATVKKPKKLEAPIPLEEEECAALVQWAKFMKWRGKPVSDVLIHIPNGAYLGSDAQSRAVVMRKLKESGLQPGVFDYIIPVPIWRKGIAGLWLEMKRTRGGTVSDDQKTFRLRMIELGYSAVIALGAEEAAKIIEAHLKDANAK